MKKITVILIIILLIAIVVAITLPKKKKLSVSLEREAPPPKAKIIEESPSPSPTTTPLEKSTPRPTPIATAKPQEKTEMKVNFYAINREKAEKGEFLGSAELKDGKLNINVSEPKLKEILSQPYSTMAGEVKGGVARDWMVTYQPGTVEHLRAIAVECWQFGYIGEIAK